MTFPELLLAAIQRSDIPLRFEPGAEEAVAAPVTEMLTAWITAHLPAGGTQSEYDAGYGALALRLLAELSGSAELPPVTF